MWVTCTYSLLWGWPTEFKFIENYQTYARTPIFSGFFTMGSFLVALKTTILSRIKETYDTDQHRITYRAKKQKSPKIKYYQGLINLGEALGVNIICCLLSALLQMTLGFWKSPLSFAICTGFALATFFLLVMLTLEIVEAHKDWFEKIEQEAQDQLAELEEKNRHQLETSSDSATEKDAS